MGRSVELERHEVVSLRSRFGTDRVTQLLKMNETKRLQARFGRFLIDEAEARLEVDGRMVELAPRAFQVLCELVRRAGQLVAKDTLLDAVWGHRHVNEAALKNIVSQLRQALGDDARESRFIQTVPRRGYRFIAPLTSGAAPPPAVAQAHPPQVPAALTGRQRGLSTTATLPSAASCAQLPFLRL